MSMADYYDWGDYDRDPDPEYEFYDRVIASTGKAILYGYLGMMFWLPKSVHSVLVFPSDAEPGEVIIEGWATIIKNKDPNWIDPTELSELFGAI